VAEPTAQRPINDWLGEGIDQDAEGEYSERSATYASEVTNRSLLTVARLADKPRLLGNVRRNLRMTLFRLEPNGEVETVHSRRQDQTGIQDVWKYLMQFRELALVDRDARFAAVATQIIDRVEADPAAFATSGYSVGEFLAEALAYPSLTAVLPRSGTVPTRYSGFSRGSQLVRSAVTPPRPASSAGPTGTTPGRTSPASRPPSARSRPDCPPSRPSSSYAGA